MTDAQLVARFLARQDDGADAAFEGLVERHGPMVMRVCRGVLRDEHDAEDAFQTTFLVLARKARSLWVKDSLASWLHGVAYRVASRARIDAMRRRHHERQAAARTADGRGHDPERFLVRRRSHHLRGDRPAPREVSRAHRPLLPGGDVVPGGGEPPRADRGRGARPIGSRTATAAVAADPSRRRGVDHPRGLSARDPRNDHSAARIVAFDGPGRDERLGAEVGGKSLDLRSGYFTRRKDRHDHDTNQTENGCARTLTLGVIAAGVVVLAQPTGGRRDQPERAAGHAESRGAC